MGMLPPSHAPCPLPPYWCKKEKSHFGWAQVSQMAVYALAKVNSPKRITPNLGHLQEVNMDTWFSHCLSMYWLILCYQRTGKRKGFEKRGHAAEAKKRGAKNTSIISRSRSWETDRVSCLPGAPQCEADMLRGQGHGADSWGQLADVTKTNKEL